jgi:hypothetical protein
MKAYRRRGSIVPLVLTLDIKTEGEWSASRFGHSIPLRKPQYPLSRRMCGFHSRYGRFGEEKTLLPLPRFEPHTVQPCAILPK